MTTFQLPEPFASIPRESFLFGLSPIQYLPNITKALGGRVGIYAKREDCNSGLAFGGNKPRKLEYGLLLVAAVGTKLGMKVALVQEKWVNWQDPVYDKAGNIRLSRLMGADTRLDPSPFGIEHKETLKNLQQEIIQKGGKPYYIPAGASDHPLGGLGFALIVCAVTGSAMAGMIAGFKLAEKKNGSRPRKIIGVDASATVKQTFDQILRIAKATGVKIGLSEDDITELDMYGDIILDDRYYAGVYGIPDQQTIDAIRFGASIEAFITDPVYEGKSLAGTIDLVRNGEIRVGTNLLYAHLGGSWL
ncbi:hypothetical protein OIDMADRAFT_43316 [Oidiodendron maius Zn]|uniref:Tryptophan synthase beta chain-like PALP domain-containing protein n=1 Tax=Oidiodendron maius (strain Zn) TaxID=913774 RepID=A0A0C3CGX9_OIDMZ|nr:hypothetical protein OIDMADRAFT_43316 [Oidiodendron maius Zn]